MSSMSKRQQARNERELHDLLRVQGNSVCADCGARNPGWASWNLGIFICMRCASLHRKLGTHISKVKSLSMDTWSSDQVENMKRNGNLVVNKTYNPKNKRPDIPLDADEVDSAMERYIRKKYQEKSLVDGKPEPPQRDQRDHRDQSPPPPLSKSPQNSPPQISSKKGRFFGFGLRASSSAYPLSRHDKKRLPPEPRVDSAFAITPDDFHPTRRASLIAAQVPDVELQRKHAQLSEMGFKDRERNIMMLRRTGGNIDRTVEGLVKAGPATGLQKTVNRDAPQQSEPTRPKTTQATPSTSAAASPPTVSTISNNPFDEPSNAQPYGLSMIPANQPASQTQSNNPFGFPAKSQTDPTLEQSFQNLQVSQPNQLLFPHSTGGYPVQPPPMQDPRFQHSMTPPAPMIAHQYGYVASPAAIPVLSNPFFQDVQQPQAVDSNIFGYQVQQTQNFSTQNPFFNNQPTFSPQPQPNTQYRGSSLSSNPFGIPPASQSPSGLMQQQPNTQTYNQNLFDVGPQSNVSNVQSTNPFQSQMQFQTQDQSPNQPQLPNFQYGQPQSQPTELPQQQVQQQLPSPQPHLQPFTQLQPQPQYQQAPLMPQQTGRYDKNSILALYNYPHLAPQPLATIQEPPDSHNQTPQPLSPAPTDPFSSTLIPGKRSVTMPASSSTGSRNPFLQSPSNTQQVQTQRQPPMANGNLASRHVSNDSVAINNLESGRHSPDAFASLSARYMR